MLPVFLVLLLAVSSTAFRLPFEVHTAVTNITKGGQTLEQTGLFYFVANLTIGTPGQLFTVIIDTTSADLLVPDLTCSQFTEDCTNQRRFNQTASTTYYKLGQTSTVTNSIGTFNGFAGKDWVVIGDRKTDLITIPNVKFLQCTKLPDQLKSVAADGVLGMGFTSISQIGGNSPFVQGVAQGDISDTFFSIWLEHYNQTDDRGTHGVIYYGGLDPVHCLPDAQYYPLSSATVYQATALTFKSVGASNTNSNSKPIQTVISTTSGYISAPTKYASAIFNSIGIDFNSIISWPAVVPCNTKISLTFTFQGGVSVTITERDLVTDFLGQCILMVLPSTSSSSIELGLPYLRGRCVYFDVVAQRIGIASAKLQS